VIKVSHLFLRENLKYYTEPTPDDTYDYSLHLLEKFLFKSEKSLTDLPSMPHPIKIGV
jgi:hypothetical protein